jgi:hypothetical protein
MMEAAGQRELKLVITSRSFLTDFISFLIRRPFRECYLIETVAPIIFVWKQIQSLTGMITLLSAQFS